MHLHLRRLLTVGILLASGFVVASCASQRPTRTAALAGPPERFNAYILRAVDMLANDPLRAGRGYGNFVFTKRLDFGNLGQLSSTNEPKTMCVAAQLEVLVEALNLYSKETQDFSPFKYLPKKSWESLRPTDLRGMIWIVEGANSSGASDAFKSKGMGVKVTFETLQPGDFVNLNRANGSGHGVVFLSYLDASGNELATYSPAVAGFKYFSSQGTADNGGLGYRYAFFYPQCPNNLGPGKRVDCKVIRSNSQRLLNTGYVSMPKLWKLPGVGALAAAPEGEFNADYFTGQTEEE